MNLLLLSNSRSPDGGYLDHAVELARELAGGRTKALFLPFAGVTTTWDEYTDKVRQALAPAGLALTGAHTVQAADIAAFELVIVGGGNTFQLTQQARQRGWLQAVRRSVAAGTPYMGWSAGANLACPTICTTNDMPIVDPGGFDALGLIDMQINPHYTNALPAGHQGETRDQRIAEFLAVRPEMKVIGLPEGDWLRVRGKQVQLGGPHPARVFQGGREAVEVTAPALLAG
ncbi:dipeptidase PepE [Achromobacter aloeverae]|uniref:Dipeptidase PepE n=1 Tax=Achromobacter aloeverae TaxID=1750518 RepID=A0A4Q1HFB7_9BURK|nr:dipeptidase PepE [Achromobacter aloeverae]RXN85330.1 dipeptidase PepE [Achromobacter aloeverae]